MGAHSLGSGLIFVPRGKSRKSRRYVPLSARVKAAVLERKAANAEGWVFSSPQSQSGHIETVQKQWSMAKKLAGLPDSVVLYCARHRFGTDAMEGTGNIMAVMDVMGHSRVDVARIYQHPELAASGRCYREKKSGDGAVSTILSTVPILAEILQPCNSCAENRLALVALPGIEPGFED